MKLARSTVFACFNYSTGLNDDDLSSFKNSTKEARLLRNDILSIAIVQIYKLSHPALGTKLILAKVKHNRLHMALPVNQSKLLTGIHAKKDDSSTA